MDSFAFCGKVIMAVSEMIFDETIQGPEINSIHTVFPGVVAHEEIGFIGQGGLVGVKGTGCSPTPQEWAIATRKVEWDPVRWEILLQQCWTDLEQAATVYSLRTGIDIPDFTDTDYMNLILEVLSNSMMDFWWRLFWFSDTAAANVTDGGIITDGIDVDYFNILDGFWKQIYTQIAANTDQKSATITENAGTTYATQRLDPANVQQYFADVVFGAPLLLRRQSDKFILVTQSVYDAFAQTLMNACCLESSRLTLLNGIDALSYNGIPVIVNPKWDEMIMAYEDTGTKLNNPHRILFTAKSVLGIGVDSATSFDNLRVWYDPNSRYVKIEGMGRADAKLTNPEMFSLGI